MAGNAVTNKFMLATATVMLGLQADMKDLNPTTHSIGLVKNFTLTDAPVETELTQGVTNELVYSVRTANPVKAAMEVYEYTAKNLSYALGLTGATSVTTLTVSTTLGTNFTTGSPGTSILVADSTGIAANDYIMIMIDNTENFLLRKVVSVSLASPNDTIVVDKQISVNLTAGITIKKVNALSIGSKTNPAYFSAKVSGVLPDGTPMTVEMPKVRITKGFNLAFITSGFGNLPFKMSLYSLVAADPFYADFLDKQAVLALQ